MGPPCVAIIDAHAHVGGLKAAVILREAMKLYGISHIVSMTSAIEQIDAMREIFDGQIDFIAVPNWRESDRREAHGRGYSARIGEFHAKGARIAKFWAAPRGIDIGHEVGDPTLMRLDNPVRLEAMQTAFDLGMTFMVHVADPNTWFAAKYTDTARYGRKHDHYIPLRRALDRFTMPWIAAHMGGFPEDLTFLDGLLEAHPNLHLDTSATKWMVRELPRHPRSEVIGFLQKWRGRIMFGTDTVTTDEHLHAGAKSSEMAVKATSHESAFDLYASRYWALRMMWEGTGEVTSPIADPDLHMIDPVQFTVHDGPLLRGLDLPADLLRVLYHDAAAKLLQVDS